MAFTNAMYNPAIANPIPQSRYIFTFAMSNKLTYLPIFVRDFNKTFPEKVPPTTDELLLNC